MDNHLEESNATAQGTKNEPTNETTTTVTTNCNAKSSEQPDKSKGEQPKALSKTKIKKINEALDNLLANSSLKIDIVNDVGFRGLVSELNSSYELPDPKTLSSYKKSSD